MLFEKSSKRKGTEEFWFKWTGEYDRHVFPESQTIAFKFDYYYGRQIRLKPTEEVEMDNWNSDNFVLNEILTIPDRIVQKECLWLHIKKVHS